MTVTTFALVMAAAGWGLLGWRAWSESRRRRRIGRKVAEIRETVRARAEKRWGAN